MLKSAYVMAMRTLSVPLRGIGILARLERAPRASMRFWIASQFAIYDVAALMRLDVPWWTFPAIDRIERWIAARNGDVRAFEYGSGASTAWLARRCRQVDSVEHDAAFARATASLLALDNVRLRVIEPQRTRDIPIAGSGRSGYEDCDFAAYVDSIADSGQRYDLIVIDGRARASCLLRAQGCLADGGLVVFDNSNRRRYQGALAGTAARTMRCRGLAPALPYRSETALIGYEEASSP